MESKNRLYNKHLGAVHNSAPLSLVQRKLSNILMKNAGNEILKDIEHRVSIKELMIGIGWNKLSKTPDNLKDSLRELVDISIEWNILGQDKKSKWTKSTLLSSVSIKDGYVYYSYSNPLRQLLSEPNIYAKLDLNIQKHFKYRNTILIWEFIQGELGMKGETFLKTRWLKYQDLLKLTYLEGSTYENRYADFIEKIIKKVVIEINDKSDINISYETESEKGKITFIRFIAEKKIKQLGVDIVDLFESDKENDLEKQILSIGISKRHIKEILEKYSFEEISNALEYLKTNLNDTNNKIINPIAYFKKSLEEGWVTSKKVQTLINLVEKEDTLIKINKESCDIAKNIRLELLKNLGEDIYKSWIEGTQFIVKDSVLEIISTKLRIDWLQSNCNGTIFDITNINNIKEIKYKTIER